MAVAVCDYSMFEGKLINKDGKEDLELPLNNPDFKYIGLYFSAHWCPPCRGFTPVLSEYYNKVQKTKPNQLEIVFVSSDRDEESFKEYLGEMPWLALTFDDRAGKDKLAKQYGIRGIPTLVILDKTGKVISMDGRSLITKDTDGKMDWENTN